ncbi:MAG: ABC transporter ATP-binding protein [Finegoldia sp.]|nr:ABC transporter ATP-binding protein [Finegoldia sp.]
MFKKFGWFIKYYKKEYILAIAFLLASDLMGLIPPYITGKLTDLVFTNSIGLKSFIAIIAFDLFVILIKYFFAMGWSYFVFKGGYTIENRARDRLMDKFLRQSQRFFERNSTGSLMARSTNDVIALQDLGGFGLLAFFDSTFFPLLIVIMMAILIDFRLTLVSIIPLPFLAILYIIIGKKVNQKYRLAQKSFDKLNDRVLEDVEGIRIIRVYNLVKTRIRGFKEKSRELRDRNMDQVVFEAMMNPVERIVPAITFAIAIFYGARLISRSEITIGQLVSFTYYLNMLVWPMRAFGRFINVYQQASASMDRIASILNYHEEIEATDDKKDLTGSADISLDSLSFSYPSSKEKVLDKISLEIRSGSSLGIVGKTGSGKTSLIKQFLDLYSVDKGAIYVNDRPLDSYSMKSFKEKIGYVPQKHMIFSKTIRDNIRFSKPEAGDEEILSAIRKADFEKDLEKFPKGLDTLAGEKGISLSGGQKQRIEIARALIKDPEILILDDAMSAVDANTEKNILKSIRDEAKSRTLIIASHRLSQVKDCDEIIVLDQGRIIERGSHEDLMAYDGWYRKQFIRQERGVSDGQ